MSPGIYNLAKNTPVLRQHNAQQAVASALRHLDHGPDSEGDKRRVPNLLRSVDYLLHRPVHEEWRRLYQRLKLPQFAKLLLLLLNVVELDDVLCLRDVVGSRAPHLLELHSFPEENTI